MRFLKSTQGSPARGNDTLPTRLDAIVDRGRSDTVDAGNHQETPRPQIVKRRFWTPDEVEEAGSEEA
jgi:hypothetical protein